VGVAVDEVGVRGDLGLDLRREADHAVDLELVRLVAVDGIGPRRLGAERLEGADAVAGQGGGEGVGVVVQSGADEALPGGHGGRGRCVGAGAGGECAQVVEAAGAGAAGGCRERRHGRERDRSATSHRGLPEQAESPSVFPRSAGCDRPLP
jgi:hypothetical protein